MEDHDSKWPTFIGNLLRKISPWFTFLLSKNHVGAQLKVADVVGVSALTLGFWPLCCLLMDISEAPSTCRLTRKAWATLPLGEVLNQWLLKGSGCACIPANSSLRRDKSEVSLSPKITQQDGATGTCMTCTLLPASCLELLFQYLLESALKMTTCTQSFAPGLRLGNL